MFSRRIELFKRNNQSSNDESKKTTELLDPKTKEEFMKDVLLGVPFNTCCKRARTHPNAIKRWLQLGYTESCEREKYFEQNDKYPDTESVHHKFYRDVEYNHAMFERKHLKNISDKGFVDDWKASLELLKVIIPQRYNPGVIQHQHTSQVEENSSIKHVFVHHKEASNEDEWLQTIDAKDHQQLIVAAEENANNQESSINDVPEFIK